MDCYYKLRHLFLLQSATRFISNCDRYYKVRWIYYKLRQVLQSAMIITIATVQVPLKLGYSKLLIPALLP